MVSDAIFSGAIVVCGVIVCWWGMTRPSAEPGNDAWSDGEGGDCGDSDSCGDD
jgi:hypothetical protein